MADIDIKELLKEFNNSMENIDEKEAKQFIQERLNISNDIDVLIKKYGEDKIIVMIQQLLDKLDTNIKKQEKQELQQKIEKAIEYIKNNKEYTTIEKSTKDWEYGKVKFEKVDEDILNEDMIKELLEILGENNE